MLRVMGIWEHEQSRSSAWGGDRIQASVTLQTWLWGGSPATPNPNRRMHGWSIPFPLPHTGNPPRKTPRGARGALGTPSLASPECRSRTSRPSSQPSGGSPEPGLIRASPILGKPGGPGAPPCLAPAPVLMRKERGGGGDLLALIAGDRDSLVATSPRKVCGGPAFVRKDLIRAAGKGQRGKAPEDVRVSVPPSSPLVPAEGRGVKNKKRNPRALRKNKKRKKIPEGSAGGALGDGVCEASSPPPGMYLFIFNEKHQLWGRALANKGRCWEWEWE